MVKSKGKGGALHMEMDIMMRIEGHYPTMTKKQRQVADYIKDNIDTMAFITLREMSRELEITEITILNACKVLGYNSFNEVKYEIWKYINVNRRIGLYKQNDYFNTDVPEYELNDKERLLAELCMEERGLLDEFSRGFDSRYYMKVARLFCEYPKIVLCGRGMSHIICQWLASDLAGVRISTVVVNTELNESVYSAIPSLDARTLLVAVTFPDYYFMTDQIARYAKKKGAKVVGITDSSDAGIAKYADELLTVRSTTRMFLNTASAPMALINLLVSAVMIEGDMERKDIGKEFGGLF